MRHILPWLMLLHITGMMTTGTMVCGASGDEPSAASPASPVVMVVMDPLCDRLACDCVEGYAQRDYDALANHLSRHLSRPVTLKFYESLVHADQEIDAPIDIVIGKDSVVRADAGQRSLEMKAIASLSDKSGDVTQTGLLVVRRDDAATTLADIAGYTVLMGPVDAAEKSSAIESMLEKHGVSIADKRERLEACSEAAIKLLQTPTDQPTAAVISSYAEPLLSGCGSVEKGQLRVIATTDPVPFISVFVRADLATDLAAEISSGLDRVALDSELLTQLESLVGFIEYTFDDDQPRSSRVKKKSSLNRR